MSTTFTLYFDGQFWTGVLESRTDGDLRAVRVTFGSEPSDAELYEWIREHGNELVDRLARATPIAAGSAPRRRVKSPKRVQRAAARAARAPRASTAAQRAIQADHEAQGRERAVARRSRRAADAEQVRAKRRQRAKDKHRGH